MLSTGFVCHQEKRLPPHGFEPWTFRLRSECYCQLSYKGACHVMHSRRQNVYVTGVLACRQGVGGHGQGGFAHRRTRQDKAHIHTQKQTQTQTQTQKQTQRHRHRHRQTQTQRHRHTQWRRRCSWRSARCTTRARVAWAVRARAAPARGDVQRVRVLAAGIWARRWGWARGG